MNKINNPIPEELDRCECHGEPEFPGHAHMLVRLQGHNQAGNLPDIYYYYIKYIIILYFWPNTGMQQVHLNESFNAEARIFRK